MRNQEAEYLPPDAGMSERQKRDMTAPNWDRNEGERGGRERILALLGMRKQGDGFFRTRGTQATSRFTFGLMHFSTLT